MKSTIILIMVALFAISAPAMAARVAYTPVQHPCIDLYQAYCGETCEGVGNLCFTGLSTVLGDDVITAVPGILCIDPGVDSLGAINWSNFVSAAQAGIPYTGLNSSLKKTVPTLYQDGTAIECVGVSIGGPGYQKQGTAGMRLWWPLMYEIPGTKWELKISYNTALWADPGNPGHQTTGHQDVWCWQMVADLEHVQRLIELFHELPAGIFQVPLISDEELYADLIEMIEALQLKSTDDWDYPDVYMDLVFLISNHCLTEPCGERSVELGIRNTTENPACCKLLVDLEWIRQNEGIGTPSK